MPNDIKNKDLSFKDVFITSFKIYSLNIKTVVALAILVYIPIALLSQLVIEPQLYDLVFTLEAYVGGIDMEQLMNIGALPIELHDSILRSAYILIAAVAISYALFMPIISSGSTLLVQKFTDDMQISSDDTITLALSNILKTFVTVLLSFSLIILGLSLFVLPGIYLSIIFAFAIPAVIVSGKWGFGALRESFSVVRGRWFVVFALIFITSIIAPLLSQIVTAIIITPFVFIVPSPIIINAAGSIISMILTVYFVMVECVWFINKYFLKQKFEITTHCPPQ